jgi:RNA polymerase sigma factor (sigma-70 family)
MTSPDAWESMQDDVALRLMEGDENVLVDLLRHFAPALEECLYGRYKSCLSREDIEDVVAVAVRQLWDYRSQYDDKLAKVWTLLYLFANREAQDVISLGWHRARQRETTNVAELLENRATPPSHEERPTPPKAREALLRDLRDVVSKLPDDQRKILLAKAMAPDGEVTAGMLADEMGMPDGTVRVYLTRAKQTVRREMARRGHVVP